MRAMLSPSQEVELLARAEAGEALAAIAASLGVDVRRVSSIVRDAAPSLDGADLPPLPPKPKRQLIGGPRGGPLPTVSDALRAWYLEHLDEGARAAAKATGASVPTAERVRKQMRKAGVPLADLTRSRLNPNFAGQPGALWTSYCLDVEVVRQMNAEAARTGQSVSRVAQDAWVRARSVIAEGRAP